MEKKGMHWARPVRPLFLGALREASITYFAAPFLRRYALLPSAVPARGVLFRKQGFGDGETNSPIFFRGRSPFFGATLSSNTRLHSLMHDHCPFVNVEAEAARRQGEVPS